MNEELSNNQQEKNKTPDEIVSALSEYLKEGEEKKKRLGEILTSTDSELKKTKEENQVSIDAIKSFLEQAKALVIEIDSQLNDFKDSTTEAKQDIVNLRTDLNQQITALKQRKTTLENELDQIEKLKDSAQENLSTLGVYIHDSETVKTRLQSRFDETTKIDEELKEKVQSINTQIENTSPQCTKIQEYYTQLLTDITDEEGEITTESLKTQLDNILAQGKENNTEFSGFLDKSIEKFNEIEEKKTADLDNLLSKVKVELTRALDINTFHEFEVVGNSKQKVADHWLIGLFGAVGVIVFANILIAVQFDLFNLKNLIEMSNNPNLLLSILSIKLLIFLPLAALGWFVFQRYAREQRLAEEYRFKSTCALHFNSYMELVEKLAEDDAQKEYREFLIQQINRLFQSPTERIYKNSNGKKSDLTQLADMLSIISPPLEKIVNVVKNLGETVHHDHEGNNES